MKLKLTIVFLLFCSTIFSQINYHKIDPIINSGHIIVNTNPADLKNVGKLNLYYFEKYAPTKNEMIKITLLNNDNTILAPAFLIAKSYQHNYISLDVSYYITSGNVYYNVLIENINNQTTYKLKLKSEFY